MNAVHFHLILNHVAIIVAAISVILLVWSLINKNRHFRKLAFTGFIVAALFAYVTFETGENAEDLVEDLSGFSHEVIEDHEHAASTARWLTLILGVAGIAGLAFYNKRPAKGFTIFIYSTLIFALFVIGYLAYTGYLGGLIRHTELTELSSQLTQNRFWIV